MGTNKEDFVGSCELIPRQGGIISEALHHGHNFPPLQKQTGFYLLYHIVQQAKEDPENSVK